MELPSAIPPLPAGHPRGCICKGRGYRAMETLALGRGDEVLLSDDRGGLFHLYVDSAPLGMIRITVTVPCRDVEIKGS